ncbi:hypothetical protein FXW78_39645 [Rhodococcus opacus]|nr:hypothetical protein [Rhodococcus opacus]
MTEDLDPDLDALREAFPRVPAASPELIPDLELVDLLAALTPLRPAEDPGLHELRTMYDELEQADRPRREALLAALEAEAAEYLALLAPLADLPAVDPADE